MTENTYLEFCKTLQAKGDISQFPVKFLHTHIGIGPVTLYCPDETLFKALRETTPKNKRAVYRIAMETAIANSQHEKLKAILDMAEEREGKEFLGEVMSAYLSHLPTILNHIAEKDISEETREVIWQRLNSIAPETATAIIQHSHFLHFRRAAYNEDIPAMEMAIDNVHKYCEPKMLQAMLCSGWIKEPAGEGKIKGIEYGIRRARELKGEGFARRVYADGNFKIAFIIFSEKSEDSLLGLAKEISNDQLSKDNSFDKKAELQFARMRLGKAVMDDCDNFRENPESAKIKWPEFFDRFSAEQRLNVLKKDSGLLLTLPLVDEGNNTIVFNSILNRLRSYGPDVFASIMQKHVLNTITYALSHKASAAYESLITALREDLPPDTFKEFATDIINYDNSVLFYRCCEEGHVKLVKQMIELAEEMGGVKLARDMIAARGHRAAYYASSIEVVDQLTAFADRIGDNALKEEIVANAKYDTYVGEKVTREKDAQNSSMQTPKAIAFKVRNNDLYTTSDRLPLTQELEGKSRYGFNPELYEALWPHIKTLMQLEDNSNPIMDAPQTYSAINVNISENAYKFSCIFDSVEEVNAYIEKNLDHIKLSDNLWITLPKEGIWNKARWKKLLMEDRKGVIPFLPQAAEIDEMVRSGRAPIPENSEDLKLIALSVKLAKLPGVAIRYPDVAAFARDSQKYTLLSPCTLGLEQEFFGLNQTTARLMRETLGMLDQGWQLKQDEGISFGNNIWRGAETNSPIISNENLADAVLATHLLNNFKIWVNSSCSLHVHAGIDNVFSAEEKLEIIKQIVVNYIKIEEDIAFLDHSLAHNTKDIAAKVGSNTSEIINNVLKAKNMDELVNAMRPDRGDEPEPRKFTRQRAKINLHSLRTHGTLEFRHHVGTNRAMDVISWMVFLDRLIAHSVENVREHGAADNGNNEVALKDLVADYVKMRGHTKIVDDQALPKEKRDLVEGQFRKTNCADIGASL